MFIQFHFKEIVLNKPQRFPWKKSIKLEAKEMLYFFCSFKSYNVWKWGKTFIWQNGCTNKISWNPHIYIDCINIKLWLIRSSNVLWKNNWRLSIHKYIIIMISLLVLFVLLALVFEIIHFIQNIFAKFSLKFRCTIIVIIYLNSLLFPLTKEIWTKLKSS